MVKDVKYSKAIVEVLYILNNLQDELISKIPSEVIDKLKENADVNYTFNPDDAIDNVEELGLTKEAKALLAVLYKNYISTEDEKKEFDKILIQNQNKIEIEKKEKYNIDNLFRKDKVEHKETALIEVKKESIIVKIINKIKEFFSRKSK